MLQHLLDLFKSLIDMITVLWLSMVLTVIVGVNGGPVSPSPSTFKCHTCHYVYSLGGVTDTCSVVTNVSSTVVCLLPDACIIAIYFDLRLPLITGVTRRCGQLEKSICTETSCYDKCEGERCNDRDAQLACISNPCKNGSKCMENNGDYTCKCVAGYTGKDCETDTDECSSNPCLYGGTCTDKVDGYVCECRDGYVGDTCQVNGVVCYTCSYTWTADVTNTRECIDDPDAVKTGSKATLCPKPRYCTTIKRFDYNLPTRNGSTAKGDIRSFLRTCDAVNRGNYCVEEVNFQRETCYSTCRKDNCNEGDGSPIERDNSTISNPLDWPELFNFDADLNGSSTTKVVHGLVTTAAILVCYASE